MQTSMKLTCIFSHNLLKIINVVTTCGIAIKLSSDIFQGSNVYKLSENYIQIVCPFPLLLLEWTPFC